MSRQVPQETRVQAEAILAAFFAQSHAKALRETPTSPCLGDELPAARVKRIMKMDACDPVPRMISVESIPLMAYACALFVSSLSDLAWRLSAKPAGRNTLQLKDLQVAAQSSRHFDFLIDVLDASEQGQLEAAGDASTAVMTATASTYSMPMPNMAHEPSQGFGMPPADMTAMMTAMHAQPQPLPVLLGSVFE